MRTHQFTIRETAPKGLVSFRARILAAIPGKSLNGRIYTRDLLKQTAPLYPSSGVNPRPFIMDHDIEHSERVVGMITGASYGIQEAMDGRPIEGLWLEALGYMDEGLFAKVAGSKTMPAFIRGVSIGGEGEGEWTGDGVLIRKFKPAELSITAFPGIPEAHIAQINLIREHFRNHSDTEVKQTSTFQIKEKDVSLEDAENQKRQDARDPRRIREGPLPPPDRGVNDTRPGLPTPTVRSTVVHQQPQATTSSNSAGLGLNPEDSTAGRTSRQKTPTGAQATAGYSPTKTAGFKKNSPSGTGLRDQETAPGTAAARGAQGSRDAGAKKIMTPKTGATTTKRRPDSKPVSGAGMDSDAEEEEEEEESMHDLGNQEHPLPGSQDQPGSHTDLKRSMNKNPGKPGENPHDKNAEEAMVKSEDEEEEVEEGEEEVSDKPLDQQEEEEEESKEHGPSPHIPGNPTGKKGKHAAKDGYDSPADNSMTDYEKGRAITQEDDPTVGVTKAMKPGTYGGGDEEEEEEEDGVSIDPIRKTARQGQNINANPTNEENQPKVLFSEAEAIQARAFSLPTSSGILQTLATLATPQAAKEAMAKGSVEELVKALTRPDHTLSRGQVAKLIENWNSGKMPKEPKLTKIVIHKPATGSAKDLSIPETRRSTVDENVVRTKSITANAPTMSATTMSTIPNSRLNELMEEEKKRPYSNVSYLNTAKRTWNRAVQELLEIR